MQYNAPSTGLGGGGYDSPWGTSTPGARRVSAQMHPSSQTSRQPHLVFLGDPTCATTRAGHAPAFQHDMNLSHSPTPRSRGAMPLPVACMFLPRQTQRPRVTSCKGDDRSTSSTSRSTLQQSNELFDAAICKQTRHSAHSPVMRLHDAGKARMGHFD